MDDDFREYVRTRGPALLRTAQQLTGHPSDAEDLLQSALFKTYQVWTRVRDHDGYVRRAMVNINISQWRRRKLEEYPSDELPETCGTQDWSSEADERLERALALLPTRMRAAILLRYYEDLSEPEIASRLGISVGTVKSTVSRAMAKLRESMVVIEGVPELDPWGAQDDPVDFVDSASTASTASSSCSADSDGVGESSEVGEPSRGTGALGRAKTSTDEAVSAAALEEGAGCTKASELMGLTGLGGVDGTGETDGPGRAEGLEAL